MSESIYDIEVTTISGEKNSMADHKGKVLLIVNTASKCGFTPQFAGLEELHKKYSERGLAVLGFPCNQFRNQDPGSNDEIASFCQRNYGVSFTMHERVDVNGDGVHPLFKHLKEQAPGVMGSKAVKWNFTKFLVDREGNVLKRFASTTKPARLADEVEALLGAGEE